jgi:signal transduction histidine kinase
LGLYIVKQLVERNGGQIELKSKPGWGTIFSLEFKS